MLLASVVALISASEVRAQNEASAASNLSPAEVVQRHADALLAKDWRTSASLTDPEELARTKAAFLPIFEKDSSHRLAARVLGTPTQLVLSTLSDTDFNARLFAFFVATSSQGSALDRFQGINIYGVAQPDPDRAYVVYQWKLPASERPIRGVQAMELRRVNGQWKLKMLADFEGLREFLASQSASRE
ncbi:MAG TPA: hypothetical protein VFK26_02165 [Gemmatimonadaceae bacterium]|nr:hypothetical protein [Gemmatimonadaceae bacterium]